MSERYLDIIEKLSKALNITLTATEDKTLTLLYGKKLSIQIEENASQTDLQFVAQVADLPPGKFRENVLFYALMANTYPHIKQGTFAFSKNLGKLIYFYTFPIDQVSIEKIHPFLLEFINSAMEWKEAIDNLSPAPANIMSLTRKTGGLKPFGIRP